MCYEQAHLHRLGPVGELLGEAGAEQVQQPGRCYKGLPREGHTQAQPLLRQTTQGLSGCKVNAYHTDKHQPLKIVFQLRHIRLCVLLPLNAHSDLTGCLLPESQAK